LSPRLCAPPASLPRENQGNAMRRTPMTSLFAMLAFAASSTTAAEQNAAPASSEAEILGIVDTFQTAISSKNAAAFKDLFFDRNIPWLGVAAERTLQVRRARTPDEPKAKSNGDPVRFIEWVVSEPGRVEERFANTRVQTDGDVASVVADYTFHVGGVVTNYGQEAWQLVRGDSGWKINSVIYSINLPPVPSAKAE
jgi:hypothetical protein